MRTIEQSLTRRVITRSQLSWRGLAPWVPVALWWLAVTGLACLVVFLWVLGALRPPSAHRVPLAVYLVSSGVVSLLAGGAALWLVDVARVGGMRLKLAVPSVLAALVIAWNVLLVSRLMFLSVMDAQLVLAFLVFGVCVALVLASTIAATMSRSIQRVEAGARRIAVGEYGVRLDEGRLGEGRELARLAHWFNIMADGVQGAFEQRAVAEANRRQLMAAISHDVRTPLASIRAMIEALDDGIITDPATVGRYQKTIRSEIRHLGTLVDELFEISRIEAGAVCLDMRRTDLGDLISDALEATRGQAERLGISLAGHAEGELPSVDADVRQVHRVLINLMQNALRHTPPRGHILVWASAVKDAESGPGVLVRVVDSGEGIRQEDLPHIFETAYRGEPSRARHATAGAEAGMSGAGLGLAIARGLVATHGGRIWAASPLPVDARALLSRDDSTEEPTGPGTVVSFVLPVRGAARSTPGQSS
ncbi:MAG: hypothetical protein IVW57_08950 [Ktedonobacterales bacterium]|nr:hypothetical protein [Ktedonobacterales bacterium]